MTVNDEEVMAVAKVTSAIMKGMTEQQRKDLFCLLYDQYCGHCGREKKGHRCSCWNDE
jgi:hypothetical protein